MAKSQKHLYAEKSLPPELKDIFNALVLEYEASCVRHTSDHRKRVNYNILADLVRDGWRKTEVVPKN